MVDTSPRTDTSTDEERNRQACSIIHFILFIIAFRYLNAVLYKKKIISSVVLINFCLMYNGLFF